MHEDLVRRYELGAELLTYSTQGLNDEQRAARPGPGAWSIQELVIHLCDSDLVGADRMKRVIAENEPILYAYDENAWIARLHPEAIRAEEAVALFGLNRRVVANILRHCEPSDFQRAGEHTESGRKTLADLVTGYINHLDYHLKFLYGKRANLGVSIYPRYSAD